MKISELLSIAQSEISAVVPSNSFLDARLIMQHVTGFSYEDIIFNHNITLNADQIKNFFSLVARRKKKEPIAYIIGSSEFYEGKFYINRNVLIPRSDTETLIDAIIDYVRESSLENSQLKILDLGVGSGCIIITLLSKILNASATAVDISEEALEVAKINAAFYGLSSRINFRVSNWFEAIDENEKFDIIVSNPPYIAESERGFMSDETLKFEPIIALYAQENGLSSYITIADNAAKFLKKDGQIFLEIGFNQFNAVKNIFIKSNFDLKEHYKDISGHKRCIRVCKK